MKNPHVEKYDFKMKQIQFFFLEDTILADIIVL